MSDGSPLSLARCSRPRDVAAHLGVDANKVAAWIKGGELSAINVATKPGGRPRYRITPEALDAFLAARSVLPAPKASKRRSKSGYEYRYF